MLLDARLNMNQQCALIANKALYWAALQGAQIAKRGRSILLYAVLVRIHQEYCIWFGVLCSKQMLMDWQGSARSTVKLVSSLQHTNWACFSR